MSKNKEAIEATTEEAADGERREKNFIENEIDKDLASGEYSYVQTHFPPESDGYLHIGHAKSTLLNSGLVKEYHGLFNLRYNNTNPTKEKWEFVEPIRADVEWLGAEFDDRIFFASSCFETMYECAVKLTKKSKAFVCNLTADQVRKYRGDFNMPGRESPCRNCSVGENLELFEEVRESKYASGEKMLRAKIDMVSPNINIRDSVIYHIAHLSHQNTGDRWYIYPIYDFARPIEDAVKHVTRSVCTLGFEDHRPFYDWVVNECEFEESPHQIEFTKLCLTNVVTGKRYVKRPVEDGIVDGWDDPRLVLIAALRRRGYTPESIKRFVELVGVSKVNSSMGSTMLKYCICEDLKLSRARIMAMLKPLKLIIDNYPKGQTEDLMMPNNLESPELDSRVIPFGRELWTEEDDFREGPPKKYFCLFPGDEVRLMGAYFVKCVDVDEDETGKVVTVHYIYDPETKSGTGFEGKKVKGTIHWVNASIAVNAERHLYENLVDEKKGRLDVSSNLNLNPNSHIILKGRKLEPNFDGAKAYDSHQFVRNGLLCVNSGDSRSDSLVLSRIVPLKSSSKL